MPQLDTRRDSWHSLSVPEVLEAVRSDPAHGLSAPEAARRLAVHGANELAHEERASPVALFFAQFRNTLVLILLAAAVLSAFLGEVVDAVIIFVIVVFCAVLGFVQEYRAGRALDALKRMLAAAVTVLRDGVPARIPARDVVPGDVLVLEAGDRIPADARIVESHSLTCDEAPLTGESFPAEKDAEPVAPDAPVADRRDIAYTGTTVAYGRGRAVVVATGMETEFGRIAREVATVKADKSPLERRTEEIGRWLGVSAMVVCAVAIVAGVGRAWIAGTLDMPLVLSMTMFAIALAVAAVPEALAAIVTGALAVGMHEMAKRNALVRRMPVVETLGCTTVICSDKTGTLTKGEMTARRVWCEGRSIEVGGAGYAPEGTLELPPGAVPGSLSQLLAAGVLCNDALLEREDGRWRVRGDPTEGALVVLAAKGGVAPEDARLASPREAELPFSSERKRMATVHRMADGSRRVFVKGAPEVVIARCTAQARGDSAVPLGEDGRRELHEAAERLASSAFRVLALAAKPVAEHARLDDSLEEGLTFLGLVGLMDPPRPEAIEAVRTCREVQIRPIMITGDHRLTATAVATEVGIFRPGDLVLTGAELERMEEAELAAVVERVSVYARVSPTDKLKIVRAWKAKGHVVAMTGDGVNDAPALKHADIGIAMGITGTDVAKEAADMVLADDNFATIIAAIERGRWIYDNIRKYLTYLLRSNLTEVVVLGGVVIVGGPEYLPLLPAAILYINLASDGLPALALGLAPPDPDLMKRPPRDPAESIFSADVRLLVLLALTVEVPILFWAYLDNYADIEVARTRIFLLFVFIELGIALCLRSVRFSVLQAPPHKWLVLAVVWEAALLAFLLQFAAVRETFGIRMPTAADLGIALAATAVVTLALELAKAHLRHQASEAALAARQPVPPALPTGGDTMKRVLIPVDGSPDSRLAVRQAIADSLAGTPAEVHLVNVQPPFRRHVSQFVSRRTREAFHRDRAAKAIAPCAALLDRAGIAHVDHAELGDRAERIAAVAERERCDLILMATARKDSLTRLVEASVTNRVIELATVPVEVVAGRAVSNWERFGIPAALAGGAAAILAAVAD